MTDTNTYDVGDTIRCSVVFDDANGTNVDPTIVTVKVKPPAGSTVTKIYGTDAEVVRDAAGAYHIDVAAAATAIGNPGAKNTWWFRWAGSGATGAAATERKFWVTVSRF